MEETFTLVLGLVIVAILGLVVAFSPTLVITELAIMTRSKKPIAHGIAMASGIALATGICALVAIAVIGPEYDTFLKFREKPLQLNPLIDTVVGLLLVLAGVQMLRQRATGNKPSFIKAEKLVTSSTVFWFGFLKMATSLSSVGATWLAVRLVMSHTHSPTLQTLLIAWLIAVAMVPFLYIVYLKAYKPSSFDKIQQLSDRMVALNWRRIFAWVLVASGMFLVAQGLI